MDKIANYATFIDYGIFGFLIFLSLLVIAIGIERLWFYSIIRLDDYEDKRELELDLHKRLTLIATIGSNAPYIGLLGTVIGIMLTFVSIGANSILDTKGIMSGLAMALRATALGLVVAIPSVVFYNLSHCIHVFWLYLLYAGLSGLQSNQSLVDILSPPSPRSEETA